ncbi:MAG TPA: hypothetical protein VGQ83_41030 [Polyangia bacterium]|jgi:hypothetical protein
MRARRLLCVGAAVLLAALLWLPCLHLFYLPPRAAAPGAAGLDPEARALLATHLAAWQAGEAAAADLARLRAANPEWDFMARTFLVAALANAALRDPARRAEHVAAMDRLIAATLSREAESGQRFFLMAYVDRAPFVVPPGRSLFVDGEIALMLGLRRLVEEQPAYRPLLAARVRAMVAQMERSPVLSGESYPDECWTFCNTIALAAIRLADALDGTDHGALVRGWVAVARARLVHPGTGLLVSSYTVEGRHLEGPEGSSIFLASHALQLVDPAFAREQYERARRELGRSFLGFGYAREWPRAWAGRRDVDSGAVVPGLEAGIGASGFMLVAAAAFDDGATARRLRATARYAGFPEERDGRRRYRASNRVGDAVLLYASVLGPAWDEAQRRGRP